MKSLLIALLVLSAVYCANKKNLCTDAERQAKECLFIYDPVCAVQKTEAGWSRVTMSNRCVACSDEKTDYIVLGECESYPEEAGFCDPRKSEGWMCNLMINPVCGYFDHTIQCFAPPCGQTFSNGCIACTHKRVSYVLPGNCPSI